MNKVQGIRIIVANLEKIIKGSKIECGKEYSNSYKRKIEVIG